MDPQPHGEVLGEEPAEPLGARVRRRLRAHPRTALLAAAVLVAVAGAALTLGTRPARPAAVQLYGDPLMFAAARQPPWGWRPDGRPSGAPVFAGAVALQRNGSEPAGVETRVVGLAGPGIVRDDSPAVVVPASGPVGVEPRAVLDCDRVPERTASGAYRLRLEGRVPGSAHRVGEGTVDLGPLADQWAAHIHEACATWSARRDLTVTALTATVDPTRSRVAVRLEVRNTGSRTVRLDGSAVAVSPIRLDGPLPLRVPPRSTVPAAFTVVLDRCDSVNPPGEGTSPLTAEPHFSTELNLSAGAEPAPSLPPGVEQQLRIDTATGDTTGNPQDTGVLLVPDAYRALTAALSQACAGLAPVLPLISPGTLRYDPEASEITVPLQLFVAPGRIRTLRLRPDTDAAAGSAADQAGENDRAGGDEEAGYLPLWKPTGDLVPDRTGRLRVDLRYRVPAGHTPCPAQGGYPPPALATLQVPVTGGTRRLDYTVQVNLFEDPDAVRLLCGTP